jgi:hypothetical protein
MRLLLLDSLGVVELIGQMDGEVKALKEEIFRLCWFMRGGITLEEAWQLDQNERSLVRDLIKDNLETTKDSGLPFF